MQVWFSLTQVQTTAMMAQVLAMALIGGVVLAAERRRTEWVYSMMAFLVVALVCTVFVSDRIGWYVLGLWLLWSVVVRVASAVVGVFKG